MAWRSDRAPTERRLRPSPGASRLGGQDRSLPNLAGWMHLTCVPEYWYVAGMKTPTRGEQERVIRAPRDVARWISRVTRGLSYQALTTRHGRISKSREAWSKWRSGERAPGLRSLLALARAFGYEIVLRPTDDERQQPGGDDASD